ncbi:MAG: sulfite exporter TauE/SafE family protein [Planctomycetaceae bacterium]|nr:sulfite exporter TauE/SafE family protein [Planctomycetaceae bacterium]
MTNVFAPIGALLLGLQTAITPCLLAMNITAIAYLGRSQNVWFAGSLYALGQVLAFWGLTILVLGIPFFSGGEEVTRFFGTWLTTLLGPLLILIGMMFAGLIRFSLPSWDGQIMQKVSERFGKWSALPLGFLFALAFCPTTAATFLLMLGLTAERITASETTFPLLTLPMFFGLGTSLPILLFAGLLATQRQLLDRTFQRITGIERPARWLMGTIFIVAGLWLTIQRLVG